MRKKHSTPCSLCFHSFLFGFIVFPCCSPEETGAVRAGRKNARPDCTLSPFPALGEHSINVLFFAISAYCNKLIINCLSVLAGVWVLLLSLADF